MREPTAIEWYRGKRVCVTGSTGLIGSYVVAVLKASGAWVRANFHTRAMTHPCKSLADRRCSFDLMVPGGAEELVSGCEIVIGCAGITGGAGLHAVDPLGFVGPATTMVENTLHACHLEKVERFGFISSTTVYPPSDEPVREGYETTGPPYEGYWGVGESKRWLEKLCRYYHEKVGLKVAVIRPSGVYGRHDNFDERTGHVIPGMLNRAMALKPGETFEIWGDGGDVRDFVHASDVARGLLLAVSKSEDADPFNIASGRPVTTGELALRVLDAVGRPGEGFTTRPDKPTALRTRLVDISKARRVLGYEPEITLAEGLADTVAWRRAQS